MQRMDDAGALVMALDFAGRGRAMHGIYKPQELDFLSADYRGALWVEKIEVIGPYAEEKFGSRTTE